MADAGALQPTPAAVQTAPAPPPLPTVDDSWMKNLAPDGQPPANENQPATDFLGARAATQRPDDSWMRALDPSASPQPPVAPGDPTYAAMQQANVPLGQRLLNFAGAAVKDIGGGLKEAIPQIAGGLTDAIRNSLVAADHLGDWLQSKLPDALKTIPGTAGAPSFLQDPLKALAGEVPQVAPAETNTGGAIRQITTFLSGFVPAVSALKALGLTGMAANAAAAFTSGAAVIGPQQSNLANLIQSVPALQNPVTDFLQAKPGDTEAEGRLKTGLEAAGLQSVAEGLIGAVKVIKGFVAPPSAAEGGDLTTLGQGGRSEANAAAKPGLPAPGMGTTPSAEPEKYFPLGDTKAPIIEDTPETRATFNSFAAGEQGAFPAKVNLERIEAPQDIKDGIARLATFIDRGTVTNEETQLEAAASGITPAQILKGQGGTAYTAAQRLAIRDYSESAAQQFSDLSKIAMNPETGTPEAKATAYRAFQMWNAIEQVRNDNDAEAGRILQAQKIMSSSKAGYSAMLKTISDSGASGDLDSIMQRASVLDPGQADQFLRNSMREGGNKNVIQTVWYNALLSNPSLPFRKAASDVVNTFWDMGARAAAGRFGSGAVQPGEAGAMGYGITSSFQDAMRFAWNSLKKGEGGQFTRQFQVAEGMTSDRFGQLANGAPPAITQATPAAGWQQFIKMMLPSNYIGAVDDAAKFMNYRGLVNALAYRQAAGEGLEAGSQGIADRISELTNDVPPDIHEQAFAGTLHNTLQDPLTGWAAKVNDLADVKYTPPGTSIEIPVGRMILPFVRIPYNIAAWPIRNSAIGMFVPSVRAELAQGGATAELAIARMSMGSMVGLTMLPYVLNGGITGGGPSSPQLNSAWQRAGNKPYSIKIGDNSYSYDWSMPLGMMLAYTADTHEAMKFASDEDKNASAWSLAFGLGKTLMNRSFMLGMSNFFAGINDPNHSADKYANSLIGAFAAPPGLNAIRRGLDPWVRAHYGLLDSIQSKWPGLSQGDPKLRNVWGDGVPLDQAFMPLLSGTGIARSLSPITYRPTTAEPIDKWVFDNRSSFPDGTQGKIMPSKPSQIYTLTSGKGVTARIPLDPMQYDRFTVLAGHLLKDPDTGLGAKDYLNALVSGNNPDGSAQDYWNQASPTVRAMMVMSTMKKFQDAAKVQLLHEYPALQNKITSAWQSRIGELTAPPVPAVGGQ